MRKDPIFYAGIALLLLAFALAVFGCNSAWHKKYRIDWGGPREPFMYVDTLIYNQQGCLIIDNSTVICGGYKIEKR